VYPWVVSGVRVERASALAWMYAGPRSHSAGRCAHRRVDNPTVAGLSAVPTRLAQHEHLIVIATRGAMTESRTAEGIGRVDRCRGSPGSSPRCNTARPPARLKVAGLRSGVSMKRMNREEFFAKLASCDEERLKKSLWNLYWRGLGGHAGTHRGRGRPSAG